MGFVDLVLLTVSTILVVAFAIFMVLGFLNNFRGAGRKREEEDKFLCEIDADCRINWGLSSIYVCDPKLKRCRVKSYEQRSCTNNSDCLSVTPNCTGSIPGLDSACIVAYNSPVFGPPRGTQCPYGQIYIPHWNLCQLDQGTTCKSTDECGVGACVNSTCQYLGPYQVCTEGSSFGENQCSQGLHCPDDTLFPLAQRRCQPLGILPREDGAYCSVNTDCKNHNCYFTSETDTFGICARRIGLLGMACKSSGDCIQGLNCLIPAGKLEGTCILADPAVQTSLNNCPSGQYNEVNTNGCVGAISPVPCSQQFQCKNQCAIGQIDQLVLGFLDSKQVWTSLYPALGLEDTNGIFNSAFELQGGVISLKKNYNILLTPTQIYSGKANIYPTVLSVATSDSRACQPLVGGINIFSTFSTQSSENTIFVVSYDPSDPHSSSIKTILLGNSSTPTIFEMHSVDLYTDFYVDQNPYSNHGAYTTVYLQWNFNGPTSDTDWTPSTGETNFIPIPWQNKTVKITPQPVASEIQDNGDYTKTSLHISDSNDGPREIFSHFFYYPSTGETVISRRFITLPSEIGGGLNTLVGIYEVARPGGNILVISTLTLYVMSTNDAERTSLFRHLGDSNMWAYRLNPVFTNLSLGINIYASVYSFVLIDFVRNWPFTLQLEGPPPTYSDTAGDCNVGIIAEGIGVSIDKLKEAPESIPGYQAIGKYPVFTPRSYTHVQSACPLRTSEWTSTNIFGNTTPSLLDVDMIITGRAGRNVIVGLLLAYTSQTLVTTLRFGDITPISFYSGLAISRNQGDTLYYPTKFYTFYLTPELEEIGGGDLSPNGVAFPEPYYALNPQDGTITSWATSEYNVNWSHRMRTPWGNEVFTMSLLPSSISPPMRFCRMPIANAKLSANGGDDIWIWGKIGDSLTCIPLFFDNLGTIVANNKTLTTDNLWISTVGTRCFSLDILGEIAAGMDITYTIQTPDNPNSGKYSFPPWNIPHPTLTYNGGYNSPLVGRMCETQGYQDGILYRARPYIYADIRTNSTDQENLPSGILTILRDPNNNSINVDSLESMALALSSTQDHSYKDSLPYIGVGSIQALLGTTTSVHPSLPNFFNKKKIVWVGSESNTPFLPGGYRLTPCPVNPNAYPTTTQSPFPNQCPDIVLAKTVGDRKSLPIFIIYQDESQKLELHMYHLEMSRNPYNVKIVNDTIIQTHGGLVMMENGYPGINGGPAIVYTPCL